MSDQPLTCRNCGVLLPRFENRPGLWVICLNCGEAFFVEQLLSSAVEPPSVPGDEDAASHQSSLDPANEQPAQATKPAPPLPPLGLFAKDAKYDDDAETAADKPRHRIRYEVDPTPNWFFVSGVFDFPWRPGTRSHWVLLSIGAIGAAEMSLAALRMTGLLSDEAVSMDMVVGLALGLVAILSSLLVVGYLSACLMAVVEDTANGCDQIQEWPEGDWRDWMPKLAPLVMAGLVAALVGFSLRRFAGVSEIRSGAAVFLAFPVALMSMLEAGSAFTPLSVPILKTFFHWRSILAWGVFYVETALFALVLAGVIWTTLPKNPAVAIAVYAFPLTAALLIYARLLGRWSWYSSLDQRIDEDEEGDGE